MFSIQMKHNLFKMENLLYVVAVVLVVVWAMSFFGNFAGGPAQLVLTAAILAILLRVTKVNA